MVTRTLVIGIASALLAACAVGPDYVRPDAPKADAFVRQPQAAQAGEVPQADAQFWQQFDDPTLNRLVDEALAANHDLRAGLARYRQASALLRDARYARLPTLTAQANAQDARSSADQAPGVARGDRDQDSYDAGFGAVWELDFFGRLRRTVEAQRADAEASAADLAGLQVAIVGELAQSYFQLRGLQAQLDIARENAGNQQRTLELLEVRREAGLSSAFDVDRGRAQLESTRARIPALEGQVAVTAHRIAVLAGKTPESLAAILDAPAALPSVPDSVSAGTPVDLLRRRPDVAAAERRLASATARIGVATADLFPRFTLGGLIGSQALDAADLFHRDSETRLLSLGIDGSFLNVGRVRARIAQANAAAAEDLALYERTVLRALEETENALVRLDTSGREAQHLGEAADAGTRAAQVARLRFDEGAIDVLELLDAENARLQAQDALAQVRTRKAQAAVSVYQSLAGGWAEQAPGERVAALPL